MKIVGLLLAVVMCAAISTNAQSRGMPHNSVMFKKHYPLSQNENGVMALSSNLSSLHYYHEEQVFLSTDSPVRHRHRYDDDTELKRTSGIITVSIAPAVLAGGATLLGFGVKNFKSQKGTDAGVKDITYVEIGVGSALMAMGIGALIDGAINISKGNRILNGKDKEPRKRNRPKHSWEY